ncbi:MAG: hypothetical protein QN648_10255 [Nitrososphaeraceae archaeon]|nr:hypothetical protein [Nitrososphaeraceae archaeon]MDW0256409.1 hypothetical protein [Nitrososphaeraceae archaeon]MDW0261188.1 hypothetical protein [Nitrososphaeraceae archaeon]MDW0290681.1 hypothetical protein [Nitrososphaeraceae archaeon]
MEKINLKWSILIAAIIMPLSVSEMQMGSALEKEAIGTEGKSNKFVDYLENARSLLNQSSFEYKNSNYTGAEELATTAYLDNFEHVEEELEKKSSHAFMEDIEHKMREELRDLIKNKVQQSELDIHINATDGKLVEAINLLTDNN